MKRRSRKLTVVMILMLLLLFGIFLILRFRFAPLMRQLVVTQAENTMSTLVNEIVNEQIASGSIDYDRIIYFEKDVNGGITALKTNMTEVNRLKTEILSAMNLGIEDISVGQLNIPIGNFLLPELFSGRGFRLPVRILSVSTSDAEFQNCFSAAGINQTLHQIRMNVFVNLSVMTPTGTVRTQVVTDVVVAETVIVGSVPTQYFQYGNLQGGPME
ncbi:MAG: sporulation protein YunB [Oscillospiraceae bacterium]|nr:sporulation protein YunB [Oscillospiraceae bacterium]